MSLSHEQYRLVLDSLSEGVCTLDREWRITSFNAQAQRLTGVGGEEALQLSFGELFDCEICECATLLSGVMSSGTPIQEVATKLLNRHGAAIPVSMNAAPLRDSQGEVAGLVVSFRDNRPLETLRKELHQKFTTGDIVSKNARMARIFDILPAVAESGSTVLILGPSGTGKELLARAIHRASPRRDQPFVAVNCGALPDNLLESELFGYRKGAFTDARHDKPGRFALAEGGTLFLDEIGDTSPAMQVKLLRVLQEHHYEPLGATMAVRCDVRVITATNRDLAALVAEESFRADLYYRINVIAFDLPPLAERREDIPLLIDHFIGQLNAERGRSIEGVSQGAMQRLLRYEYPGNIRELRNVIEHAYVMCQRDQIQEQCLPPFLLEATDNRQRQVVPPTVNQPRYPGLPPAAPWPPPINLRHLAPEAEAELIRDTLAACNGHRGASAARLGINPSTLWRKMKRYDIQ